MSTNSVSAAGITIQTFQDCVNEILNGNGTYPGLLQIYGPGLAITPNSPDAQMVNIYAQGKVDVLEQALAIATSFDPDQATGILLDQRCAINGVFRMPGSYTVQPVTVTVSQALNLPGLDLYPTSPFTVQDGSGNQYQLVSTYSFGTAGAVSLIFQAAVLGPVTSAVNTITIPVTVLAGVTSVNNPAGPNEVGQSEELDSALRIRRGNSVALPSKGWLQGMYAGLLNVNGVTQALALENRGNTANSLGMPPHSIWLIVAGSPVAAQVGAAIYAKRNACVDWMNGGQGAVLTPVLTGTTVASVTMTNEGTGWTGSPTASFTGGGGTGAAGTPVVSGGKITGVTMTNNGSGYTSPPVVSFSGTGTGATAVAVLTPTTLASITVSNGGLGYDNAPAILITGGGGSGATATSAVSAGVVTGATVTAAGSGFTALPTITLNPETVVVPITQEDGTIFDVYYDTPTQQNLWFRATLTAITGSLDKPAIAAAILAQFGNSYGISQAADTAAIIAFIVSIAPNASVASEGVSTDGSSYSTLVSPTNVNYQFTIPDSGHIAIT